MPTLYNWRDVEETRNQFNSFSPGLLVHEGVNVSEPGGEQLHHAALRWLPEQPGQVETSCLEDEDEDDPLVKLVVSPAKPVAVNVILAQARVGIVNPRGPVEPEIVVSIARYEREGRESYLSLRL